jgi:hypothetical protein
MPELILNQSASLITKLIDKGEFSLIIFSLFVVIGILVYLLNDALNYKVLSKQMNVYRDRISPIIDDAKTSFARSLQDKIHNGEIKIDSLTFGNSVASQCDLVDTCFLDGERYMRDRLFENHVVPPSSDDCPQDNCMTCTKDTCRDFREYAKGTFNALMNVIIGKYKQRYSTRRFYIDTFERVKVIESKIPEYYKEWCKMVRVFSKISKDRWRLK